MNQTDALIVTFRPESNDEKLVKAVKEYQEIWQNEGERIVSAMTKISSLRFQDKDIEVIVYEGVSFSGRNVNMPMKLRASYPSEVKKATLIHELNHRLLFPIVDPAKKNLQFDGTNNDLDAEQINFLTLYDTWTELYGKQFADKNVEIESRRKGIYDYAKAWRWALDLGKKKRVEIFAPLVKDID